MPSYIDRRRLLLAGASLAAATPAHAQAESFEISNSETATIDGRDWDKPKPGGNTVDAVHRSVLLRFPTAAQEISDILRLGRVLARAELSLGYNGYEIVPEGYICRDGIGRKLWTEDPPTWHVEAIPLRHPWMADPEHGPTFNASVNGRRYWARFGAADPSRDRYVVDLPAQELSGNAREARFDITRLLATPALEQEAGARLRWLEQGGFLLRKVETYDSRYRRQGDAYEWAMPTGGHGLRFASPKLVIAGRRTGGIVSIKLPIGLRADWEINTADGSKPTALQIGPADLVERARRAVLPRGVERPAWELKHLAELRQVGGDAVSGWADIEGDKKYKAYQGGLLNLLAMPPRYWMGWEIEDLLLIWYLFRDQLPGPVQEHLKNYWKAWLQPDLPTESFVHPQSADSIEYWKRTHDWRGHASFFRAGYNYQVSTQNFNHTAAMGALLGGAMIGAERAMADGRHGLETLPLRFWGFLDGTTQEILDHYYLSITLSGQKMFADFAPTPVDRLMGRVLVDRTMEMLVTLYHSRLRRFVSSSGRARLAGVMVEQDGIYGALHTLSKDGAVKYADLKADGRVQGMAAWGYDFPPGRVAMQALAQPWGPSWFSGLIDDKPVPFEETSAETTRGFFKPPLWRRSWLGRWHGLASTDIRGGTFDVLAQWVRAPQKSTRLEDLGSLTVRYCANQPDLVTTGGGISAQAGITLTFQSRNRAIIFTKPHTNRQRFGEALGTQGLSKLATVIGLWNFNAKKDWEIYADDRRIELFPLRLGAGTRLLIKDGVTYLAILPLPSADLGRDAEIEIGPGGGGKADPTGADVAPALIVSMYNMKRAQPLAADAVDHDKLALGTYGGFVLEMGDVEQYGSFEAFQQRIKANTLTAQWSEERHQMKVAYKSGDDLMEAGFGTEFGQPTAHFSIDPGSQEKAIPWRRLNGEWPYLASGLERNTSWAQQGTTGKLEKNGAVLTTDPGRKGYLICDPVSGGVLAYNPLPDPQGFSLTTRDGATFKADGKVGLLRLEYRPWNRELDITHALKPDQNVEDFARSFTLTGLKDVRVVVNGKPAEARSEGDGFKVML
jgi:hypothetical protein